MEIVEAHCNHCFKYGRVPSKQTFRECGNQTIPSIKEGYCPNCLENPICKGCRGVNDRTKEERLSYPLLCKSCREMELEQEEKRRSIAKEKDRVYWVNHWMKKLEEVRNQDPEVFERIKKTLAEDSIIKSTK